GEQEPAPAARATPRRATLYDAGNAARICLAALAGARGAWGDNRPAQHLLPRAGHTARSSIVWHGTASGGGGAAAGARQHPPGLAVALQPGTGRTHPAPGATHGH